MGNDVIIRVEGVSKKFCRNLKKSLWYGVKDTMADLAVGPCSAELRPDEFWAVDDVSFELKRGDCLGLIGRNGAGKTTLLKMLNGLIKPDRGRIELHGRVGALLALGAGFHPILTGRENIYINGSVLGLSKREIDQKLEEIVDFAEIDDFIDAPVQSYSSGMQVRLGFAIASYVHPDILLVDEVLAVGDAGFRTKCYNKMFEIRKDTAIIFVSHSMPQIGKICTNGLVMRSGRVVGKKTTMPQAVQSYLAQFDGPSLSTEGTGAIEIKRIRLRQGSAKSRTLYPNDCSNVRVQDIAPDTETILELECEKLHSIGRMAVLWSITDPEQKLVAQAMSEPLDADLAPRHLRIRTTIDALDLNQGNYTFSAHIFESNDGGWNTVLGGLRDFVGFSIKKKIFVGSAPILYPNHTEVERGRASQ